MREDAVERDAFFLEHAHAERERAEHAVELRPHEVGEGEAAVGRADDQRAALVEPDDRLPRQVVVGEEPAGVRISPSAPRGTASRTRRRHPSGAPAAAANRSNSPAQAASSLAPLLQCTIATGSPAGVVTRSSS